MSFPRTINLVFLALALAWLSRCLWAYWQGEVTAWKMFLMMRFPYGVFICGIVVNNLLDRLKNEKESHRFEVKSEK